MSTHETSPSSDDDLMQFVAALVRTYHQLPSASDCPAALNGGRDAKSPKRATRHESADSDQRESQDRGNL